MKTKVNQKVQQNFLIEFGKHLRKLRKKQNMTQEMLAEKCMCDISKICKTEQGKHDFRISSLLVLSNGLDVNIEELISFSKINLLKNTILQDTDIENLTI